MSNFPNRRLQQYVDTCNDKSHDEIISLGDKIHHSMFACFNIVLKLNPGEHFCGHHCSRRRIVLFLLRQMAISHLTFSDPMFQIYVGSYVNANTESPQTPQADTSSARFHAGEKQQKTRSLCGRGCAAGVLVRLTIEVHH